MSRLTNPPRYQPDAIPTTAGWKHPTRNEILVSIKLDPEFCANYGKQEEVLQEEVKQIEIPVVEDVKQEEKKQSAKQSKKEKK